jgi:thiol:disulfide interchange protein
VNMASKHHNAALLGTVPPNRSFTKTSSFAAMGLILLADVLVGTTQLSLSPSRIRVTSNEQTSCGTSACSAPKPSEHLARAVSVPTGKPRLLELSSKHCPSCARMAELVKSMERNCTAQDGTILHIDVDGDEGAQIAEFYNVEQLPTFIMIDSNGDEVERLIGEQPRQRLAIALTEVNAGPCMTL